MAGAARRAAAGERREAGARAADGDAGFEELRGLGYEGGYDAVRRYARVWLHARGNETAPAYVPLSFAPGEVYEMRHLVRARATAGRVLAQAQQHLQGFVSPWTGKIALHRPQLQYQPADFPAHGLTLSG